MATKKLTKKKKLNREDELSLLLIDQFSLDKEWVEQPSLVGAKIVQLAEARHKLDIAKTELDDVYSKLDKMIREDPERFGLEKITETALKNTILGHKKYKEIHEKVIELSYQVNLAQGIVTALEHRKKALEKLVDLWLAEYFSSPKISSSRKTKLDELQEENVNRKLRRK